MCLASCGVVTGVGLRVGPFLLGACREQTEASSEATADCRLQCRISKSFRSRCGALMLSPWAGRTPKRECAWCGMDIPIAGPCPYCPRPGDEIPSEQPEETMYKLKIYGASDDLLEVEGDIREEFYIDAEDEPVIVGLCDGSLLRVTYDGLWHINVIRKPEGTAISRHEATDEDNDYSDILNIESDKPIDWVVVGKCARPS